MIFIIPIIDNEGQIPPSAESRDIFGILGIINFLAGNLETNCSSTSCNSLLLAWNCF